MATSSTAPQRHCPVHHGPESACPYPELGDALDTLRGLQLDPTLVTEHAVLLDDCGACPDDAGITTPFTAVVRVAYTTQQGGVRYHEDACPLHVGDVVRFWRTHGRHVCAFVPVPADAWGPVVRGAA